MTLNFENSQNFLEFAMAAMPGSLVPLVSMTSPTLGVASHQQMLNSSILVSSFSFFKIHRCRLIP